QKKDAQPQDATASIFGKVTDAGNGSAVMGAHISLMNENTGITRLTLVREDGSYQFASLKAGNYILKVELQGFDKHEQHGIILKANLARRIDVDLQPEKVTMGLIGVSLQPLRTLYENSDRIVIATIADASKVRTTLNVSSTIKGEGHKPILY